MLKRKSLLMAFLAVSLIFTAGQNFKTKAMEYSDEKTEDVIIVKDGKIEVNGRTYNRVNENGKKYKIDYIKKTLKLMDNLANNDNVGFIEK